MPRWKNGHRGTYTHAIGFAMSSQCRHPEAAWRFIRWLGSVNNQRLLSEIGDTVPVRLSVEHSSAFLSPDTRPRNDKVFLEALNYSHYKQVVDPAPPDFLAQELDLFVYGEKPLDDAMSDAQKRFLSFTRVQHSRLLR
jgi:multiple sugar transport system substrate-binding protein